MSNNLWNDAIKRVILRLDDTAASLGERFPHWSDTDTGEWVSTEDGDWTGGFYVGMHWLSLLAEGSPEREARAYRLAQKLRPRVAVDTVFKSIPLYYGCSVGAILGHGSELRSLALEGARSLVQMYNPVLKLIPLGTQAEEGSHIGDSETSIDSMQAAPFLFWAAKETNDAKMRDVAFHHADTISALQLRESGAFIQASSLDLETGEHMRHFTHKGYSHSSTWARSQAWGILHTTMSYLHDPTQERWLSHAMRGADWWLEHVPEDRVAYWDFDDPAIPDTERDTAATAMAAAALLKLATVAPAAKAARYRDFAEATTKVLVQRFLTPVDSEDRRPVGMLTHACFAKRPDTRPMDASPNCELIVGDYYFLESLMTLAGHLKAGAV